MVRAAVRDQFALPYNKIVSLDAIEISVFRFGFWGPDLYWGSWQPCLLTSFSSWCSSPCSPCWSKVLEALKLPQGITMNCQERSLTSFILGIYMELVLAHTNFNAVGHLQSDLSGEFLHLQSWGPTDSPMASAVASMNCWWYSLVLSPPSGIWNDSSLHWYNERAGHRLMQRPFSVFVVKGLAMLAQTCIVTM